jgi:hypothetical protein
MAGSTGVPLSVDGLPLSVQDALLSDYDSPFWGVYSFPPFKTSLKLESFPCRIVGFHRVSLNLVFEWTDEIIIGFLIVCLELYWVKAIPTQ